MFKAVTLLRYDSNFDHRPMFSNPLVYFNLTLINYGKINETKNAH